jgi:hypothetical protein
VCEEAEKATRAMAASMPPLPLLKKLKAYVHHANLRVRAKAAVAISHCAARMVRHATPRPGRHQSAHFRLSDYPLLLARRTSAR